MLQNAAVNSPGLADWLTAPEARDALAAALDALAAHPGDPLAASAALRRDRPGLAPDQAAAALEQAGLGRLAAERYGTTSDALLLTRNGLEQATRPEVARHRARLIRQSGAQQVLDLTGGLGFDARALLDEGLAVTAVERDPLTAALLVHNCPTARVVCGDATTVAAALLAELAPTDVVFADPARRDPDGPRDHGRRAPAERDPARWSPPWPFLRDLAHPRIAVKASPAFEPPADWHAEWVSVDRTLVECAAYSWPAFAAVRRALAWRAGTPAVLAADPSHADSFHADRADPITGPVATGPPHWLAEPDPAVGRAGCTTALLRRHPGLAALDRASSWLAGDDDPGPDPFVRCYRVRAELTGSTRQQRRQLDALGVSALAVKCRDVHATPGRVLRELGRREGNREVLVVTRRDGREVRYLCDPAQRQSA